MPSDSSHRSFYFGPVLALFNHVANIHHERHDEDYGEKHRYEEPVDRMQLVEIILWTTEVVHIDLRDINIASEIELGVALTLDVKFCVTFVTYRMIERSIIYWRAANRLM